MPKHYTLDPRRAAPCGNADVRRFLNDESRHPELAVLNLAPEQLLRVIVVLKQTLTYLDLSPRQAEILAACENRRDGL